MILFYLKEKPTTPLCHGKTMKKHMFQWKNWWKQKKMRKTYTRCLTLGWGFAEISLPLEEIKDTKRERLKGNCLESSWAVFTVFLSTIRDQAIPWMAVHFFITFIKKFITQITWNAILYHWHASPTINYGKFLVLLFSKTFPTPTTFSFFFWFAPDDSLRENNKTLTAPLHFMNIL